MAKNILTKWTAATNTALLATTLVLSLSGCSSILKAENSTEILKNDEFDKVMNIQELPPEAQTSESGTYVRLPGPEPIPEAAEVAASLPPEPAPGASPTPVPTPSKKGHKSRGTTKNANKPLVGKSLTKEKSAKAGDPSLVVVGPTTTTTATTPTPGPRQPPGEDSEGFVGRRPKVDPYRVGEKVTMEASYFNVVAGDITFEVKPFVEVNGRKSYRFVGRAESTSIFAMFYAVDDWAETFVDFETMVPYSYALHVKESKQLREARSIFDWKAMKASFWDKKINSEKKVEEKKQDWDIPAYSQNVFSAPFYLRSFQLRPGKRTVMRVAHENENLVMTVDVLRRERISTPAGDFNTVVVKPKIELNGVFKPVGDIFVWLTDDDRKLIVRIESKIKIGKVVAVAKKVELGQD